MNSEASEPLVPKLDKLTLDNDTLIRKKSAYSIDFDESSCSVSSDQSDQGYASPSEIYFDSRPTALRDNVFELGNNALPLIESF